MDKSMQETFTLYLPKETQINANLLLHFLTLT